jgi:hypothetical protein
MSKRHPAATDEVVVLGVLVAPLPILGFELARLPHHT